MVRLDRLQKIMKEKIVKDKIIKGGLWLCGFSSSVVLCAILIAHGNNIGLILGIALLPFLFYCVYKAIRLFLDLIFE